jgi:FixJ family two-component response regulator
MRKPQLRVAVVDDEAPVRKALRRLLCAAGLEAETFASGQEFLEWLKTHHTDCLVLDLQMPGLTGFEVQQHLLRTGVRLPVVIITGHDEPTIHAQCLSAGAAAYLCKPLDDETLLAAITQAVDNAPPLHQA